MKRYTHKSDCLLYTFCLLLLAFSACKKEVTSALPGGQQDVALNFYSASDVNLSAYSANVPAATACYIDKMNPAALRISTTSPFPVFDYHYATLEYPYLTSRDILSYAYYNYNGGDHRLFFTDTANTVVLDTVIHPAAKSYNCLYLADAQADAQNKPPVYKLLSVQEDRTGVPGGKIGVRFVHLSPDAGSLTCNLLKADGSLTGLLPDKLNYGQASPYQYLDSTAASAGLVKFSMNGETNGVKALTGVPFLTGRAYIIVITGFINDQQRQVRSGTNADGSTKYATVNISKNLRAIVRKSY